MSFPKYEHYKDSGVEWLGEVPAHWAVIPLFGSVLERNESNRGMKEENLLSLSYGRIIRKDSSANDGLLPESFETYQIVHPRDIVFRLTDLQNDKRSLRTAIVNETGIITSAYLAVSCLLDDPGFMAYLFRAFDTLKVFYSMGGGLRQSMKFSDLKRMPTLRPPLEEQAAIVTFLDHETAQIDVLIAEQQRLIELLKEKRQAVISQAVTKGLDPRVPMKDSGVEWLGEVPAHWDIVRLASIFQQVAEDGVENLPILSVSIHSGVSDKEMNEQEMDRNVTRSDDRSKYKRVLPRDLVYNMMRAWQGGFGSVTVEGMVSPAYVVARPICEFVTEFIEQQLRTPNAVEEMRRHSQGVTDFRLRLYWEEFKTLQVVLPSIETQREIIGVMNEKTAHFDALTAEAQTTIALLQERRSALISAAVTGKIDVRQHTTEAA